MSLENLKKRISYRGGARQVDRMIQDKAKSLAGALNYSYQSATAGLADGREFRCLINPNKISMELDDKMISIPFQDYCLNSESQEVETIGVKVGDVVEWKENGTHWLIYSQYLQEIAYFRGLMRQCENEPIDIGGVKVWYYLKGPDEKSIDWIKTKHLIFNDLNYNIEIYISNNPITKQFFHRFAIVNIRGRNFEVQAVDDLTTDGILAVYLKETYSNKYEVTQNNEEMDSGATSDILGPTQVHPFDIVDYSLPNAAAGAWQVSNSKMATIISATETDVKLEISSGKSGTFDLCYLINNVEIAKLSIKIQPY